MKTIDAAKALDEQIENALILAGSSGSIRSISESVIRDNPELIETLRDEWMIEHIERLVIRKRAAMSAAERSKQMPLPGFELIPLNLRYTERGSRRSQGLLSATHWQLRGYLAEIRKRQAGSPRIAQIKGLMELIEKWKKRLRTTRQLTVAEAMEREAAK